VESQVVEFGPQGSRRRQFLGRVTFLGDELTTQFLGSQSRVESSIAKLRIGLAELASDVANVVQEFGEFLLGGESSAIGERIVARDAGSEFVQTFANGDPTPSELSLSESLTAGSERLDGASEKEPTLWTA
jgi:hypothetical protein